MPFDRWDSAPGENTGMVFVDLDNLWGYARDNALDFDLDQIIEWLTPENTGIDRILDVHVFTTRVKLKSGYPYTPRYEVKLANPDRFCIHPYLTEKGEKGYPDDEMYRNAWNYVGQYRTGVFISNDKGVAEAAAQLRHGYDPYSHTQLPIKQTPEFLIISTFTGKNPRWIDDSGAIDLDGILHARGIRGPVNRPTQP